MWGQRRLHLGCGWGWSLIWLWERTTGLSMACPTLFAATTEASLSSPPPSPSSPPHKPNTMPWLHEPEHEQTPTSHASGHPHPHPTRHHQQQPLHPRRLLPRRSPDTPQQPTLQGPTRPDLAGQGHTLLQHTLQEGGRGVPGTLRSRERRRKRWNEPSPHLLSNQIGLALLLPTTEET